ISVDMMISSSFAFSCKRKVPDFVMLKTLEKQIDTGRGARFLIERSDGGQGTNLLRFIRWRIQFNLGVRFGSDNHSSGQHKNGARFYLVSQSAPPLLAHPLA